jgi:predicted DNA binding CopG/RHH family protein
MLTQRAVEEGLPYQSRIASILHKYVNRLTDSPHFMG